VDRLAVGGHEPWARSPAVFGDSMRSSRSFRTYSSSEWRVHRRSRGTTWIRSSKV
jgi:hypothetical protein